MRNSPYPKLPLKAPSPIERLPEIAFNLWWSWHPEAQALFERIDPAHWAAHHNPVKLLRDRQHTLRRLSQEASFVTAYRHVLAAYTRYLAGKPWFLQQHKAYANALVAYFSAEFGLHECLPIYSGGLGTLAGDHLKSASDLGLPLVGIGLLYKNGYFQQRVDASGRQIAKSPSYDFGELPILPALNHKGQQVTVEIELPGTGARSRGKQQGRPGRPARPGARMGKVFARVWQVLVGRVRVLLLDANLPENSRAHRRITGQLYGGDRDMRLSQEILLGFGGVRALRALGIRPGVWHLNEGHVALSCLERLRELMLSESLDFAHAVEAVASNTVFTTHTPVAAGNESFTLPIMDKYLRRFCEELDIDLHRLLGLGLQTGTGGEKYFSMTVMALRLSSSTNAVSALHGRVARSMWKDLWPRVPEAELPITHVTNGVHTHSWLAPEMGELFDRYLGAEWRLHVADSSFWQRAEHIPDAELWRVHQQLKTRLIEFARARLVVQLRRQGESAKHLAQAQSVLDPNILTIGFARRFAPYKRADLLFTDLARLEKIVNNRKQPVQIIYAGKAHPQDGTGQAILRRVYRLLQRARLRGKVIFLEDYDMSIGRYLVQGVDVWLNNPRRPMEASGTSGQKVPINGGINCSVLDGWWCEGYNGRNGWAIGGDKKFDREAEQDLADAADLYGLLEKTITRLYYKRSPAGLPEQWIKMMKASLSSLAPVFNTEVMLCNYIERLYLPTLRRGSLLEAAGFTGAAQVAEIKEWIRENWPLVYVTSAETVAGRNGRSQELHVEASVYLGQLPPDVVHVELYCKPVQRNGKSLRPRTIPFKLIGTNGDGVCHYRLVTPPPCPPEAGSSQYHIRVLPKPPAPSHKHELGLIHWWKLEEKSI